MPEFDPCLQLATNHKFGLSEADAKALVDDLKKAKKNLSTQSDYELKFRKQVQAMKEDELRALAFQKVARKNQVLKNKEIDDLLANAADGNERFQAYLVGSTKKGEGYLDSIANRQFARKQEYIHDIIKSLGLKGSRALSKITVFGKHPFGQGLFDEVDFQRGVVFELMKGEGSSGMPLAQLMSAKIREIKRKMLTEAQKLGVNIGELDDHVTAQFHDPVSIRGKEKLPDDAMNRWINDIYPLLNKERVFRDPNAGFEEHKIMLKEIYTNIVQNKREVKELGSPDLTIGRRSLASKVSQHRVLHFKDPDAWIKYNSQYGHRNPIIAILNNIERFSDDLELMKALGPNPENTFKRQLANLNLDKGKDRVLKSHYALVSAQNAEIVDPTIHKWTQITLAIQNMSKLGSAVISAFTDPLYTAFTRNYHGVNFFTAYYETLAVSLRKLTRIGNDEVNEFAEAFSIGLDGIVGSASSRVAPARSLNQNISQASDNFFRINGLNGWTNFMREGAVFMMANDLRRALSKDYRQLNNGYRRIMSQYNIGEKDWEMLKQVPADLFGDKRLLTPDKIKYFAEDLGNADKAAFLELSDKLRFFYIGENTNAVLMPMAREQAFMARIPFGGEDAVKNGTPAALAAKTFWQFRGFGVTMMMRNFPRVQQMGLPAFFHLIPMVGIGYGVKSLKDILSGKEPLDPADPDNILTIAIAGVLQSGFGGIAADYLVNDYRKYGRGFPDVVGGPAVGSIQDIAEIYSAASGAVFGDDTYKDVLEQTWNAISNHIPYSNHYAFRTLFEYNVNYYVKELLNPGSLNKMQKRFERENNQRFITDPIDMRPASNDLSIIDY